MTRQQAITAYCRGCICDSLDTGTWRQQVDRCPATDCALYQYRPRSKAKAKVENPPR